MKKFTNSSSVLIYNELNVIYKTCINYKQRARSTNNIMIMIKYQTLMYQNNPHIKWIAIETNQSCKHATYTIPPNIIA